MQHAATAFFCPVDFYFCGHGDYFGNWQLPDGQVYTPGDFAEFLSAVTFRCAHDLHLHLNCCFAMKFVKEVHELLDPKRRR